ncbi:MAG: pyocin knob domain-containing protein [Paenirhodobacter sp.]|uniref:pyocin knob domain-containing protein n=1 Tax=Paenirhodobacter sp. TaxID=1965326 RepID=UPI003D099A2D
MSNLPETDVFPEGIYQIETTDPVVGGAPNEDTGAGLANIPAQQLAKRTRWLRNRVDALLNTVVAASTAVAGLVKLNTATNSTSTTTAATPSAVKAANDNAETRALKTTTITAGGLATGGGNLSGNRTITVTAATDAEGADGIATGVAMTPKSTRAALSSIGLATASAPLVNALTDINISGVYRITDPAGAPAGVAGRMLVEHWAGQHSASAVQTMIEIDGVRSWRRRKTNDVWGSWDQMTSAAQFGAVLNTYGYQMLPSGLIIQWGLGQTSDTGTPATITFPVAFPTRVNRIIATANAANYTAATHAIIGTSVADWTPTSFKASALNHMGEFVTTNFFYFATGC